MKIKFMLEYSESPFWAIDDEAQAIFGYNINMENFELSFELVRQINIMMNLYYERLNPIYQNFPSLWSGNMNLSFQQLVKQTYSEIKIQMNDKYEIFNEELELINNSIDIYQIDKDLKEFIENPSIYADEKGVNYGSKEKLNYEIKKAYQEWVSVELQYLDK